VRTHILAIDPGLKPGVAQFEIEDGGPARLVRVSHKLSEAWIHSAPPWDILATEGQWYYGGRGRGSPDVNDLLKLAFRAGFTLASIPARRRLRIPPQEWRSVYGASLSKEQVQARIARELTTQERALFAAVPAGRHGDVLDAIGIGRRAITACWVAGVTEFDWTL
jgi:hypothetical protein